MNTKKSILLLPLLFLLNIATASAQGPFGPVGSLIQKSFSPIFFDFASKIGTDTFFIWIRIMLFVILYSVLYVAANNISIFAQRKNIAITISLAIALISSIMIPNVFITAIAKTYGMVAVFLFMLLPIAGLLYLAHVAFPTGAEETRPERRRFNHVIKILIYYVVMTILQNYNIAIGLYGVKPASWDEWSGLMEGIVSILMIYHLFAALFFGTAEAAEGAAGETIGDWWRRAFGGAPPGEAPTAPTAAAYPANLVTYIAETERLSNTFVEETRQYIERGNEIINLSNANRPVPDELRDDFWKLADGIHTTAAEIERIHNEELVHDARFRELNGRDLTRLGNALTRYTQALMLVDQFETRFATIAGRGQR